MHLILELLLIVISFLSHHHHPPPRSIFNYFLQVTSAFSYYYIFKRSISLKIFEEFLREIIIKIVRFKINKIAAPQGSEFSQKHFLRVVRERDKFKI